MFADTDGLEGAVPLAGATVSQVWSSDAVKFSEPPPVFVTFTVCAAGLAPPWVALNARLAGVTARAGAGLTVRVTSMVLGEPEAPAAVTVMVRGVGARRRGRRDRRRHGQRRPAQCRSPG